VEARAAPLTPGAEQSRGLDECLHRVAAPFKTRYSDFMWTIPYLLFPPSGGPLLAALLLRPAR
jgi:hypothetical protein